MSVLEKPTFQKPSPPHLPDLLDQLRLAVQKDLNCVRIGVIISYDPGDAKTAPTASVQIAQKQVTSIDPKGVKTLADYPPLQKLPVYFPNGGGYTLTFPVQAGDECLVLFNDRELDNWLFSGAGVAPTMARFHDLSDGIVLVGLRSNPRAMAGISNAAVQLRSDSYTNPAGVGECIEISPGKIVLAADELVLHGRLKTAIDAGGTGRVYQPAVIDDYTDGVPVNNHPPAPPEVPT